MNGKQIRQSLLEVHVRLYIVGKLDEIDRKANP